MKLLNKLNDAGWEQVPYMFPTTVRTVINGKQVDRALYVFSGMTDKEIVTYTEKLRNISDESILNIPMLLGMPGNTSKEILDSLNRLLIGK